MRHSLRHLRLFLLGIGMLAAATMRAAYIFLPMDEVQKNHLKAYGIVYWVLQQGSEGYWLLNYRGGSFAFPYHERFEKECRIRGVTYEVMPDAAFRKLQDDLASPAVNMDVVKLDKAPRIAVYSPKTKQPWDDAVTLVLTYAEIPYDVIYDDEVLADKLLEYDWLHLHHEDFTGQFGKFWASYRQQPWYRQEVREAEAIAQRWGYRKVSELKLAVAKKIRDYVIGGGYLFAMCSATDTYDIALAAEGVDICETPFDGDPADPRAQEKLDFGRTFAFRDFRIIPNPYVYEFSSVDATQDHLRLGRRRDFFVLHEYSAKWDPIPTMLCQNHTRIIKGFMGQTTAYRKKYVKPNVLVLGETGTIGSVKYLHGEVGRGMWTFYGGHDPEDYQHFVGDPPTNLDLYPNSPGYRLILNNVLFPAARPKKRKT